MGDADNVFNLSVGKKSFVFVGTAVPYAQFINDGFTQKKGQFVPGYWKGSTFHYDRSAEGGMVLTGKVIPGVHMMEKTMDQMEDDLPDIMEFEFRRLYALLFKEGG